MGIQGLWPLLKDYIRSGHVGEFRGRRVAVDAYVWLHRAVFGCCVELAQGRPSDKWLKYCIEMIDSLLAHDISVYLVFDGAPLPAKQDEERERRRRREEARSLGMSYLARKDYGNARMHLSRAIDVSPKMAAELIALCKEIRPQVRCLVAPYEADAQLAYLCSAGLVDAVITEDSDTVPYFCKEVIIKLEKNGSCQIFKLFDMLSSPLPDATCDSWEDGIGIDKADGAASGSMSRTKKNNKGASRSSGKTTPELTDSQGTNSSSGTSVTDETSSDSRLPAGARTGEFRSFDRHMLVAMSVAAGCDYLPSLDGIGIKKSFKYISKHRTASRMLRALRFEGVVPMKEVDPSHYKCTASPMINSISGGSVVGSGDNLQDQGTSIRNADSNGASGGTDASSDVAHIKRMFQYEFDFYKAFMTFFHQTVFDPIEKKLRPLHPFPENSAVAHSCIWRPVDACASSDSDESMTPPTNAMSGSSTPVSDLGSVIGSESVASSQLPQLRATAEFSSDPSRGISLNGLASVQPTSRRVLERHIPMCMYEGWVDVDFLGPICIAHRKGKSVTQDDSALMLAVAEGRADPVTLELFDETEFTSNVLKSRISPPDVGMCDGRSSHSRSHPAVHAKTTLKNGSAGAVRSAAGGLYVRTPKDLSMKPHQPKDGPLHRFMHRQPCTPSPNGSRQLPGSAPASLLQPPHAVGSGSNTSSLLCRDECGSDAQTAVGAGISFPKHSSGISSGANMHSLNSAAPQSKSVPPRGAISRFFANKSSYGGIYPKADSNMSGNVKESLQRLAAQTSARAAERIVELDSYLSISEMHCDIEVTSASKSTVLSRSEDEEVIYSFADSEVVVKESGSSRTPSKTNSRTNCIADFSSYSNITPSDQRTSSIFSSTSARVAATAGPVFDGFASDVEETFCYSVSPVKRCLARVGTSRSAEGKRHTASPLSAGSPGLEKRRLFSETSPAASEANSSIIDSSTDTTIFEDYVPGDASASCSVTPIKKLRGSSSELYPAPNRAQSLHDFYSSSNGTDGHGVSASAGRNIGTGAGPNFGADVKSTAALGSSPCSRTQRAQSDRRSSTTSSSSNLRTRSSHYQDIVETRHAGASTPSKGGILLSNTRRDVSPSRVMAISVHPSAAAPNSPPPPVRTSGSVPSARKLAVNVIDLSCFENDSNDAFY